MKLHTCLIAILAASLICTIARADDPLRYNVPKAPDNSFLLTQAGDWGMPITRLIGPNFRFTDHPVPNVTFRLAWDERDLILLADVEDKTPNEAEDLRRLYSRDSIEIYIAPSDRPRYRYQLTIAPGYDHHQPRVHVGDRRPDGSPELSYDVQRLPREDGYRLLVRLPFSNLDMQAKAGQRLRMQLVLNDGDASNRRRTFVWYPSGEAHRNPDATYEIRLATKSNDRHEVAGVADFRGFRDIVTLVQAPKDRAGQKVRLYEDGKTVGRGQLTPDGEMSVARIHLPLEKNQPERRLTLAVDGDKVASVAIPRTFSVASAINQLSFGASTTVFWEKEFPPCDFERKTDAQDALGWYRVETNYYDADLNEVTEAARPGRYAAISKITAESGETFTRYTVLYRSPEKVEFPWWAEGMAMVVDFPPGFGVDERVAQREKRVVGNQFTHAFRQTLRSDGWATLLAGLHEMDADGPESVTRTSPAAMSGDFMARLRMKVENYQYPFAVSLPADYEESGTERYPLILFLHGAGERGTDLARVRNNLVVKHVRGNDLPFIVVSPQCPPGEWWSSVVLDALLTQIGQTYCVDPDRIYITGLSMGGFGTWDMIVRYPDRFAAAIPVCGIGDRRDMGRISDLPVWVFHGDADDTVPIEPGIQAVEALRAAGGRVRFTIYPGVGHDSWTPTYTNPEIYSWLLKQKRGVPAEPKFQ